MSDELTTEDYIWQLKNSPDPDERLYAAFKLGRDRQSIVIQPLVDATSDVDTSVRVRVAEALGTRGEVDLVLPALAILLQDEDPLVRRTAADSMGKVASEGAIQPLHSALEDPDAMVRSHAVEALGKIPVSDAAPALVRAFLQDEDANVRYFAKQSLGQLGSAAIPTLLETVSETHSPDLLAEMCEILGIIGDVRSRPILETLADHSDNQVTEIARWALGQISDS